ncbi:hypothetical protein [Chryseolinea sp. H1M3-3]|uniref:hypothetical protein n=1 Tax=Chryseolinea sp. H1M3-3 TaxID=3034144 RepID=UPI0023EB72DA|nr:hypothetical protein [Chryseolinea sp. H1M3-3]
MSEIVIVVGLVIFLGGVFYFLARQHNQQLDNINEYVYKEAKTRGLQIKSMINPTFQEWLDSPFEREIKVGTLGFEGIPYNREYYRVLKCLDTNSNLDVTMWVKVTRSYKTNKLTLEWLVQN